MNHRALLVVLIGAAVPPLAAAGQNDGFVWRTSDMAAEVVQDDAVLGIGQYLMLRQSLRPGESGWTVMKIDLPETWQGVKVALEADTVAVTGARGARFRLTSENVGELGFRILDGSKRRPDIELETIWREVALDGPPSTGTRK